MRLLVCGVGMNGGVDGFRVYVCECVCECEGVDADVCVCVGVGEGVGSMYDGSGSAHSDGGVGECACGCVGGCVDVVDVCVGVVGGIASDGVLLRRKAALLCMGKKSVE